MAEYLKKDAVYIKTERNFWFRSVLKRDVGLIKLQWQPSVKITTEGTVHLIRYDGVVHESFPYNPSAPELEECWITNSVISVDSEEFFSLPHDKRAVVYEGILRHSCRLFAGGYDGGDDGVLGWFKNPLSPEFIVDDCVYELIEPSEEFPILLGSALSIQGSDSAINCTVVIDEQELDFSPETPLWALEHTAPLL